MVEIGKKNCGNCGAELLSPDQRHCHECGALARQVDNDEILNFGSCPLCGRYSLQVTTTSKPRRHLKCGRCGARFVTVEVFLLHHDCFSLAGEIVSGSKMF